MTNHLFLDLESTVINPIVEGWHDYQLINIELVKPLIPHFDTVNIFSFAIHDEHDLHGFNKHVRPALETALGVRFTLVPIVSYSLTHPSISVACARARNLRSRSVTLDEVFTFWGKGPAFEDFVGWGRHPTLLNCRCVLIDDDVLHKTFKYPDKNVEGEIICVNDM